MPDKLLSKTNGIHKMETYSGYPGIAITETITNGFFEVDKKWIVKYWNGAAEKILGVLAKDIVGKNLWESFVDIIPINFYTVYQNAFLQDIPIHFKEYWAEKGAWFDVITYHSDDTLSVSFKSSNHPRVMHPQLQLKILNELYRYVTEVTNDCLWEWDFKTNEIFWIDGGHKRVFGYHIENALIPQSFWESRLHPDDKEHILTALNEIILKGIATTWEVEYRFKKANGEYAYVHDRGHIIYDGDKIYRMIGATQDITERMLLQGKLKKQEQSKQQEIIEAVLTAQENERAEIGKEMHDNVNQILVATRLYLEVAKSGKANRDFYLKKSSGYIMTAIEEIRRISKSLIPPGMHDIGLVDSIKNLLDDLSFVHKMKIEFNENGITENMDEKLKLTIFRIVQEQINNILNHAQATTISINLSSHDNKIILLISDDGKGYDMSKTKKGLGIRNITSRAELYHGNVTIISKPGDGYKLRVELFSNKIELN